MDERILKFRVGVMVLAAVIVGGILVLLFGDTRTLARGSYAIHMHFSDAPGVSEGTPVRKSGILIGRVTSVRFAEQGGVNVEAKIDGNVKLYRSEVPQVSGSLLGGDVVIQFVRRPRNTPTEPVPAAPGKLTADGTPSVLTAAVDPEKAPPPPSGPVQGPDEEVQPEEYIEGMVAPNAFQVLSDMQGDLGQAIQSLSGAGTEVSKLAGNINKLLESNDEQINRIVNKTEGALDTFQRALASVDDMIGDKEVRDSIKSMLKDMPALLTDSRATITTIRTTVESVDRNLRNMEGLTGPLGERGEGIVTRVDEAVTRLDDLLGILSDFGRKLNSGEGSLGMLMRNPELYQNLNSAAKNIEQVSRELKPIVSDVRVFSDRIARHPELLGVRGAIQKSPGTKWPAAQLGQ